MRHQTNEQSALVVVRDGAPGDRTNNSVSRDTDDLLHRFNRSPWTAMNRVVDSGETEWAIRDVVTSNRRHVVGVVDRLRLGSCQFVNIVRCDRSSPRSTERLLRDAKLRRSTSVVWMINELGSLEVIDDEIHRVISGHAMPYLDRR